MSDHRSEYAADAAEETAIGRARPSDEMLPFLNNFHDVFTTIGLIILGFGLILGVNQVFALAAWDYDTLPGQISLIGMIGVCAAIFYMLSALLVGRQRRILPGIFLSLAFAGTAGVVLLWLYSLLLGQQGWNDWENLNAFELEDVTRESVMAAVNAFPPLIRLIPVAIALSFTVPAIVYYLHFRLPFAGGLSALGIACAGVALFFVLFPYDAARFWPSLNLAIGLFLFVLGLWFDMRDPARVTRLAGTGFWMHFFAAPILISSAVSIANSGFVLSMETTGSGGPFGALAMDDGENATRIAAVSLAVIIAFALISLLINRRALIVSGLITAGVSIGILVSQLGFGAASVAAVTLLTLGGVVVLLGAAWTPVRRILLIPFPKAGPLARLFPPPGGAEG